MKRKSQNGAIAIEASIALTLFIFFMLALYSFITVFEAQGKVSSALFRCMQSLSLDSLMIEKNYVNFTDPDNDSILKLLTSYGLKNSIQNKMYVSDNKDAFAESNAKDNPELASLVKDRFTAYLTSEGTVDAADNLLNMLNVDGGLDGLDFSESKIDSNGILTINVKYKVNYIFDVPTVNIEPMEFNQGSAIKLWKEKSTSFTRDSEDDPGSGGGSSW